MNKPVSSILLGAISLLCLTGCDEDWGDKVEAFVDNEVHMLTMDIAQKELDVRWFDYFVGLRNKSILDVHGATKLMDTEPIAAASLNTFEEREQLMRMIDAAESNNIHASRMLQSAIREINSADLICESTAALRRVDIDSMGTRIASQIALPKNDWYVELSCQMQSGGSQENGGSVGDKGKKGSGSDCWKSLVSIITTLWGADKQREQKDKAESAIARIPSKVVSAHEVEQISKNSCRKIAAMQEMRDGIGSARQALTMAQKNTQEVAKALAQMRLRLEVHQMPLMLSMVRDATGIERTANDITAEYELQRVMKSIEDQRKDLEAFETRFKNAAMCNEVLATSELLDRVLAEKRLQLEAAVNSGNAYGNKFSPLLNKVVEAQKIYAMQREAKVNESCALSGQ